MLVRASLLAALLIAGPAAAQTGANKMASPHTAPAPTPAAASADQAAKPVAVSQTTSAPAAEDRVSALKKRISDAVAAGDCDAAKELAMRGGDEKTIADTDAACKAK